MRAVKGIGWLLLVVLPVSAELERVALLVPNVREVRPLADLRPLKLDVEAVGGMMVEAKSIPVETVGAFVVLEKDLGNMSATLPHMDLLEAHAGAVRAVGHTFMPQRVIRETHVPWFLSPFQVWSSGPAGRLRAAADEAWAEGDTKQAKALRLEYWQTVNESVQRRDLFERLEAEEASRSRVGLEDDRL